MNKWLKRLSKREFLELHKKCFTDQAIKMTDRDDENGEYVFLEDGWETCVKGILARWQKIFSNLCSTVSVFRMLSNLSAKKPAALIYGSCWNWGMAWIYEEETGC